MRKLKFVNGDMIEYEELKLVDKYDPILRQPTEDIDFGSVPGKEISFLGMSLMETLNKLGGLGLSANQVGLKHRIMALNLDSKIWCLINPKVIERSSDTTSFKEGCLSFPGLFLTIGRPSSITVEFQAFNGEKITQKFDGLTATVVQHELDHLDGKVFTDLVPKVILERERKKIKKNTRRMATLMKTKRYVGDIPK